MPRNEPNYWERRLSRRWLLRSSGVAGIGVAGAALVGCGDDDDGGDDDGPITVPTQAPATIPGSGQQAKTGGTLRVHMGGSPRSLDPHFDTFPYNTAVTNNTNERLLRFKSDFSGIEPELATAMPEQPDNLTFTFKLQQGVKYQNVEPVNGREFTSADVKYSIERQMTDEAGKYQHAYFFLGAVDRIETPDKYTVTFKMKKAYAPFISYIASPWTVMVAKELVEKDGDLTQRAIGTGPFIFKEWQKDVKITLVKNPDYREKGKPYLDGVEFRIATDPDTAATLYIDKQVDATIVGQAQLGRTKDAREKDSNYKIVPSQFWRQFRMMPTTKDAPYTPPFSDKRVREAIVKSINAKQVLDLVYSGDGIPTFGPILPIYPLWALKEDLAKHDLKAAKDLLSAAGFTGFSGPMIWATGSPQADQIGEVLKQQLKEINVDVQLQPMELAAYYNQTYAYKYTFSHHVPLNNPDPDENLSSYFGRNSRFFKHYNETIWAAIDKQAEELDTRKRQELVQDVQKQIVLDFPMKFMFTTNLHEFTDKKVKGWFYHTDLYDGRLVEAWLDA